MSFNGSGTFSINSAGQPVVTGTTISSTVFNALTADLATGLSTTITKDGQTATTLRIPFALGINSTLSTDSSSTATGSIITAGGIGVAKAMFIGTTLNVAGVATLGNGAVLGTPASMTATNITGTAASLTSGITNALASATTTVNVSSATAPTTGQVLTATGASTATWQDFGGFTTGDVKLTLKTTADAGWVLMDDKTIGNGASGATGRANADTVTLYTLLWNNTADAQCAVSTGRGANAAADYAANKTIALPKALGRALATYGSGSGLTARALALAYGVETHPLITAELASHNHGVTDPTHSHTAAVTSVGAFAAGVGGASFAYGGSVDAAATGISIQNNGSGTAHQNMQPSLFLNTMIKL